MNRTKWSALVVPVAMLVTMRVASAQPLALAQMSVPPNDTCETAAPVQDGDLFVGNNIGATPLPNPPDDGISRSGAVWHVLQGTGEMVRATTCHGLTGAIDTVIDVYKGNSCTEAIYTGLTNDNVAGGMCPDGYSVERSLLDFQTTAGETYYITVSGKDPTYLYPEEQYALVVIVGDPEVTCSVDRFGPSSSYVVSIAVTPNVGTGLTRLTVFDDAGGSAGVNTYDGDEVKLHWGPNATAGFRPDGTPVLTGRYVTLEADSAWGGTPCVRTVDLTPDNSSAHP